MTTPRTAARRGPIVGVLLIAIAVLGGAGLWYLFFRPSGPAPVALGSLPPTATAPVGSAGVGADPTASSPAVESLEGVWTTDASASPASGPATFVGYRVREELANIGATEAVGRTPDVSGLLEIAGTTITRVEVTADLTTLQSDNRNRDRQLSRQALETEAYPQATFTLTDPIELGSVPAEGQVVEVTATGDLTLHGVTKSVQVPLQARLAGDTISVAGSLRIAFADFGIARPQAMVVLSVEDTAIMELLIHFRRSPS